MAERIASLFAEISADTKKFDQGMKEVKGGLEKAEKQTKSFGDRVKDEGKRIVKTGAGIAGAAFAIKKAFDFAQEGAQFVQLSNSTKALGVDLQSLRDASRGTVSDFSLMNATQTLLIGTQGDLKSAFIDNAAQLLEIAKAANAVNPALGNTSFLYESIARGIKRSSPLILDNLGLVIKVGEANEKFAAAAGKTVGELTAQDKQMALLNATLEAGNVLLEQAESIGGNVVDAYASITASAKNYFSELQKGASQQDGFLSGLGKVASELERTARVRNEFNRLLEAGLIAEEEVADATNLGITMNVDAAEAIVNRALATERSIVASDKALIAMEKEFVVMRDGADASDELTDGMTNLAMAEGAVSSNAQNATDSLLALFLAADPSSLDEFQQGLDNIQFVKAGGNQAVDFLDDINRAAKVGIITAEQYEESFAAGFIAQQALNVELGDTTAADAAKNVARELGDAYGDPLALVKDLESALERINGLQVEAQITIITKGNIPRFPGGATGPGGGGVGMKVATRASGGPLNAKGATLVGERGSEMIIGNHVFTHEETLALLKSGIKPTFEMAFGGNLGGGAIQQTDTGTGVFSAAAIEAAAAAGQAAGATVGGGAVQVGVTNGTGAVLGAIGSSNAQAATGQQQTASLVSQLSGVLTKSVERSNANVVAAIAELTAIVSTDDGMGSAVSEAFRTSGQ